MGIHEVWCRSHVIDKLNHHMTIRSSIHKLRLLALLVYGLVLFPTSPDRIDLEAARICHGTVVKKINPVPAILADTFLSLNFIRSKGEGKFLACEQLLYVWMISHLGIGKSLRYADDPARDTLREMAYYYNDMLVKQNWEKAFAKLHKGQAIWRCRWMAHIPYINRCGQYPWVPLIGVRGCISYCPAMVVRQLGYQQGIPRTKGLSTLSFYHDGKENTLKELKAIQKAWPEAKRGSLAKEDISTSKGYPKWQESRGKGYKVAVLFGPRRPEFENAVEDLYEEFKAQQEILHEDLQKEVQELKLKSEALEQSHEVIELQKRKLEEEKVKIMKKAKLGEKVQAALIKSEGQVEELHAQMKGYDKNLNKAEWALKAEKEENRKLRAQIRKAQQERAISDARVTKLQKENIELYQKLETEVEARAQAIAAEQIREIKEDRDALKEKIKAYIQDDPEAEIRKLTEQRSHWHSQAADLHQMGLIVSNEAGIRLEEARQLNNPFTPAPLRQFVSGCVNFFSRLAKYPYVGN